jgi:peptide-methionine (S)-S-oxide reductase
MGRFNRILILTVALASAVLAAIPAEAAQKKESEGSKTMQNETITLGGGCFWCMEAVFQELKGVEKVESGYSGGSVANPSYRQVCSGTTGHAEVVQVTFDPKTLSLDDLLRVFFAVHDPTTLNRQGADVGSQYRSIILYRTPEQRQAAQKIIAELEKSKAYDSPIVTQVVPFHAFFRAEDYHQDYYLDNSSQPYCQLVIAPKLAKFRKLFKDMAKP